MKFRIEIRHLLQEPWQEVGEVEAESKAEAVVEAKRIGMVTLIEFAGEPIARAVRI